MAEKIEPVFDGTKIWRGLATAYGSHFCIEVFPSSEHPGYYHMSWTWLRDSYAHDTKKPMRADGVQTMLNVGLKMEGLCMADMSWQEVSDKKELSLHHPELGQINDKV
jgi:hypothetical protein